jgi:hypothetical protein
MPSRSVASSHSSRMQELRGTLMATIVPRCWSSRNSATSATPPAAGGRGGRGGGRPGGGRRFGSQPDRAEVREELGEGGVVGGAASPAAFDDAPEGVRAVRRELAAGRAAAARTHLRDDEAVASDSPVSSK